MEGALEAGTSSAGGLLGSMSSKELFAGCPVLVTHGDSCDVYKRSKIQPLRFII